MKVSTTFNTAKPKMASVGLGGRGGHYIVDDDPDHFSGKLYPKYHQLST